MRGWARLTITDSAKTNRLRVIFGLGEKVYISSIEVRWTNGVKQKITDYSVDKYNTIKER